MSARPSKSAETQNLPQSEVQDASVQNQLSALNDEDASSWLPEGLLLSSPQGWKFQSPWPPLY